MNKKGLEFIKEQEEKIKKYNSSIQEKYKKPKFQDSIVQERIMRLGIEARLFGLDGMSELEQIAVATLIEDFLKNK